MQYMSITDARRMIRQELKAELSEIKKLLMGQGTLGNWVKQEMACISLGVEPRQLRNIRYHLDKDGKAVGCIKWRKGKGRLVEYWKPDLEKYRDAITVG